VIEITNFGWIFAAILAAIFQTFRTAYQKKLISLFGDFGSAYTRFIMAFPFTILLWIGCLIYERNGLPNLSLETLLYCVLGSFFQVIFTIALMNSFNYKNFATGVAFSKIDVLFAALIEILILNVVITNQVIIGICIGSVSVLFLSFAKTSENIFEAFSSVVKSFVSIGTPVGLLAGLAITLSQIFFRLSIVSMDGSLLNRSLFLSVISLLFQIFVFGLYLYYFKKEEFFLIFKNLKACIPVGISGTGATVFWFIGFGLATVAEVKAVGQVELIFSVLISIFIFRERIRFNEFFGILLLSSSILIVIFDKV